MGTDVTKFSCEWINSTPPNTKIVAELNSFRQELFDMGLIGIDSNGFGFGNLSKRLLGSEFLITGTQTGGMPVLDNTHYTNILDYSLENNSIVCIGSIQASSETLTHAALYHADNNIKCIAHVHHLKAWLDLINKFPTTNMEIEYGTPDMAKEMIDLYSKGTFNKDLAFVMGGHKEGFIIFGNSIQETRERIHTIFNSYL